MLSARTVRPDSQRQREAAVANVEKGHRRTPANRAAGVGELRLTTQTALPAGRSYGRVGPKPAKNPAHRFPVGLHTKRPLRICVAVPTLAQTWGSRLFLQSFYRPRGARSPQKTRLYGRAPFEGMAALLRFAATCVAQPSREWELGQKQATLSARANTVVSSTCSESGAPSTGGDKVLPRKLFTCSQQSFRRGPPIHHVCGQSILYVPHERLLHAQGC